MKRNLCLFALMLAVVAGSLVFSPKTAAITYGFVDSNNTFANTGAFIVKSPNGQIFPICSGTMITANVFLTASHCTLFFQQDLAPEGYAAYVSLDGSIPFGALTTNKTQLLPVAHVVTNPNYNAARVIQATLPFWCCRKTFAASRPPPCRRAGSWTNSRRRMV